MKEKRFESPSEYFSGLVSPASIRLGEFVRTVAPTDTNLLLIGKSGTEKEELAQLIHFLSPRARGPFVTVHCNRLTKDWVDWEIFGYAKGAFPGALCAKQGKIELACGGTLFFDEIGDLSLSGQSKLLKFLRDKVFQRLGQNQFVTTDTRVIAATRTKLEDLVLSGDFRKDLLGCLSRINYRLVSLRFRNEDLPILVTRILKELREEFGEGSPDRIPDEIMRAILVYHWPGNLGELKRVLERAVILAQGRELREGDFPKRIFQAFPSGSVNLFPTLEQIERRHIKLVLSREKNLERVAEILGITTVTLWRKRKQYGLSLRG